MPANTVRNAQPVHTSPVAGYLDTRSTPDEVPFGSYRRVLNMELTHTKKLCRTTGWRKLLSLDAGYNNSDLHDQLGYTRQHLTFAFQAVSPAGFSKLFVGTQNRIYSMTPALDTYRIISDQLGGPMQPGCAERRWRAGQVDNTIVFTNNHDEPVYHIIDQPPIEALDQSVTTIPDLRSLKITRASVVIGWNGLMFLANLMAGGQRVANRIIWSDYGRPLSYRPAPNLSIAGSVDLDSDEAILAILPLIDRLLVYTTRGIWEGVAVGASQGMLFSRRYKAPKQNIRCLAFPNTLVSTGGDHYYWGLDGIYRYSLYDPEPVLVEWIHRATAYVFNDLNKGRCNVHVGGYYEQKKTIYWSWAREGETCPSETIAVNVQNPFCSFIDHGFSVFTNFDPDQLKSIRDWLLEQCVCTQAEMNAAGSGYVMEGKRNCVSQAPQSCPTRPTCFYSASTITDGDLVYENFTGEPDADSLFARLGSTRAEDLCSDEWGADECNAEQLFVGASASDQCLKEFGEFYYREALNGLTQCVAGDTTGGYRGTYVRQGYRSKMLSGAMHFKEPEDDKLVTRFAVEQHPVLAVKPSQLKLRVGMSSSAVDPLDSGGNCAIIWQEEDAKLLECLGGVSAAQHAADHTVPNDEMEWGLYYRGRYLYFELEILNPSVTPADTGGAVCFSRFTFDLGLKERLRR